MFDLDPFNTHLASKIQRNKSQLGSGRDGESRVYTLQLLMVTETGYRL